MGESYETQQKDFTGYKYVRVEGTPKGTFTAETQYVTYYYVRPSKVIVNHVDIDTNARLIGEETKEGFKGDGYTTEQKTFEGYEYVKVEGQPNGTIEEEITYVTYFYKRINFNLKVEKIIDSVIINGETTKVNGDLGKIEINRKDLSTAKAQVVYKIVVTNTGDVEGVAEIQENIPEGMKMVKANNPDWKIGTTVATAGTKELSPKESQEFRVVLDWVNGENNIGTKENKVEIEASNKYNVPETTTVDNKDTATVIVAIGTGDGTYIAIMGAMLLITIGAGVVVYRKFKK